jgi:hypothetical protein
MPTAAPCARGARISIAALPSDSPATLLRARLQAMLRGAGIELAPNLPEQRVVDCRWVGWGDQPLGYLSRYLYRGVLSAHDRPSGLVTVLTT